MKISLLQMDIAWADQEKNRATASRLIDSLPGSDLYILPEMFSTGFATKPDGIAEADGATLQWMKDKAKATGAAICGSVATKDGERYYNRMYFVKPDGSVAHYDKHHLFTYSGEDKRYTPGNEHVIVEWKGFRIMLEVCYDLRFPKWVRNSIIKGTADKLNANDDKKNANAKDSYLYDIIIYVASWPVSRQNAWETLLRARAIENQCWVAGVNRVGKDPGNTYVGGSLLIDPWGNTLAGCIRGEESIGSSSIDLDTLTTFRKSFPVLADAD